MKRTLTEGQKRVQFAIRKKYAVLVVGRARCTIGGSELNESFTYMRGDIELSDFYL